MIDEIQPKIQRMEEIRDELSKIQNALIICKSKVIQQQEIKIGNENIRIKIENKDFYILEMLLEKEKAKLEKEFEILQNEMIDILKS